MNIRIKIIVTFVCIMTASVLFMVMTTVPFVSLGFTRIATSYLEDVYKIIEKDLVDRVQGIEHSLSSKLDFDEDMEVVYEFLRAHNNKDFVTQAILKPNVDTLIDDVTKSDDRIYETRLMGLDGIYIHYSGDHERVDTTPHRYYAEFKDRESYISMYENMDGMQYMLIIGKIYDMNREHVGYFSFLVDFTYFEAFFTDIKESQILGNNGYAMAMTANGERVIYHPSRSLDVDNGRTPGLAAATKSDNWLNRGGDGYISEGLVYFDENKEQMIMYGRNLELKNGWYFGVAVDERSIVGNTIYVLLFSSLLALVVAIGGSSAVIIFLSKYQIVMPILSAKKSCEGVESISAQVKKSSSYLSQSAAEQASSIEEVSASMEEISSIVENNTSNAKIAETIVQETLKVVQDGNKAVNSTASAMKIINDKIILIQDIASSTNLLALNAAIEAARAGEAGRGFSVVASEVKRLAERAAVAAEDILNLSQDSVTISQRAGDLLNKIVPDVQRTSDMILDISHASQEQSLAINQIKNAILELDKVTQLNSNSSDELARMAENLNKSVVVLDKELSTFGISSKIAQKIDKKHGKGEEKYVNKAPNSKTTSIKSVRAIGEHKETGRIDSNNSGNNKYSGSSGNSGEDIEGLEDFSQY